MSRLRPLSRRTFLRGAGAAVALPALDAMVPRSLLAGATKSAAPPVRLAFIFFPNGTNADQWQPRGEGENWELTHALEPLADLRRHVTVFSGLSQINAESLGDGPGDHARSASAFLTSSHPLKTGGGELRVGKSIDQVAADAYGRATRLPSIELGTEPARGSGACDSGYACAYSSNISWRTPSQPMAKEIDPRLAFDRLFGGGAPADDASALRMRYRKSILDMVASDAAALRQVVGRDDRRKLDEYFESVRDVERRIDRMMTAPPADLLVGVEPPKEEPASVTEHIRLMLELLLLAFRTDTTRVATFMLANEGSGRTYPFMGVNDGHHPLSHHRNEPEKIEKIAKIDRYFVEQFAHFVDGLSRTADGAQTLLDNTLVLYGGAIRDGNRHDHDNLPILLAGRGGGIITPGRHLRMPDETPLANLFLNMLDAVGVEAKRFGDSTGRLTGLTT